MNFKSLTVVVVVALCLSFTAAGATTITWNYGSTPGVWDTGTANWTGDSTTYADGDNVIFGTPLTNNSGNYSTVVNLAAVTTPGNMSVNTLASVIGNGSGPYWWLPPGIQYWMHDPYPSYTQYGTASSWDFVGQFGSASASAGALTVTGSGVVEFTNSTGSEYFSSVSVIGGAQDPQSPNTAADNVITNVVLQFSPNTTAGTYAFGMVGTTPQNISLNNGGTFDFNPDGNGYTLSNSFTVGSGGGGISSSIGNAGAGMTATFSGGITLSGNLTILNPDTSTFYSDKTATLSFTGAVSVGSAARTITLEGRDATGALTSTCASFSGNISGAGALTLDAVYGEPCSPQGGDWYGNYGGAFGYVRNPYFILSGDNTGLTGGINITGGGMVIFNSLASLGGGGAGSVTIVNSVADINYAFSASDLAMFSTASTGVLAFSVSSGENINLTGYAEGLRIGAAETSSGGTNVTLSGMITPQSTTYWLGGGNGSVGDCRSFTPPALTISSALTDLTSAHYNVDIGTSTPYVQSSSLDPNGRVISPDGTTTGTGGISTVTFTGANTYTGYTNISNNQQLILSGAGTIVDSSGISITSTGNTAFAPDQNEIFTALMLQSSSTGNRIGDAAPILFNGGTLKYTGYGSGTNLEQVGAIELQGQADIVLSNSGGVYTQLQAASLLRQDAAGNAARGTVNFYAQNGFGASGNANSVLFTTPPALSGGGGADGSTTVSILPYATVQTAGNTFYQATYNSTYGIRALTPAEYATTIAINENSYNNVNFDANGYIIGDSIDKTTPDIDFAGHSASVNCLRITDTDPTYTQNQSVLGSSVAGAVLTIKSGSILFAPANWSNDGIGSTQSNAGYLTIAFPSGVEGVITVASTTNNAGGNEYSDFYAPVSGNNGLTFNSVTPYGTLNVGFGFNTNNLTGPITINSGIINCRSSNLFAASDNVLVINGPGIFFADGSSQTVGGLSGAGMYADQSGSLTINVVSGSYAFDGQINGTISLGDIGSGNHDLAITKTGLGTQILNGAIQQVGGTLTVSQGELDINGSLCAGWYQAPTSNFVNVSASATLGGSGTINRFVSVANGGIVKPGSAAGNVMTVIGDFSLNGGACALDYALGTVSTRIDVTGNLTLAGLLNVTDSGGFGSGIYRLFNYTGNVTNNGLTVNSLPAGTYTTNIAVGSGQVNLLVGQNYTWTGGGSPQDWSVNGNWTATGYPQTYDNALFDLSASPVVNVNGSQAVGIMTLNNPGVLTLSGGPLTVLGAVTLGCGQTLQGNTTINGSVSLTNNSFAQTGTPANGGTLGMAGGNLTINGTLTVTPSIGGGTGTQQQDYSNVEVDGNVTVTSLVGNAWGFVRSSSPGSTLTITSGSIVLGNGSASDGFNLGPWSGAGNNTNLTFAFGSAPISITGNYYGVIDAPFTGTGGMTVTFTRAYGGYSYNVMYADPYFDGTGLAGAITLNDCTWWMNSGNSQWSNKAVLNLATAVSPTAGSEFRQWGNQTFGGLTGLGTYLLDNGTLTIDTSYFPSANYTFNGAFSQSTQNSTTYALTKTGAGTQVFNCALPNGQINLTGGTLTVNNTVPAGLVGTETVAVSDGATLNGSGTINRNVTVDGSTVGGSLAFYGDLTMTGAGALNGNHVIAGNTVFNGTISGTDTFNGTLEVQGGTLDGSQNVYGNFTLTAGVVGGNFPFGTAIAPVAVAINGGTFAGPHTIHGNVTAGPGGNAIVAPSNDTVSANTLTVVGNVTLDHSTTLDFNLGTPGTIGGGINDLIDITGNLSLDGTLNVTGLTGFSAGTYTLFTYTGALTEPSGPLTLGSIPSVGYNYTIDTTSLHQVNLDVVMAYAPGDVTRDGVINSLDIDAIYHNFGAPATSQWKVDGDGNVVGQGDVTYELHTYFHTNYGDANLDTKTDFSDFQVLLDHWQVSGPTIGWAQGDFNGSYSVDFLDFQILLDYWNPGGWSFAPAQTPEPASLTLLLLGGLALLRRKKLRVGSRE